MNIIIKLPYENAQEKYKVWANSENSIDFRKQYEYAERCTVSFAAVELENYLSKLGFIVNVGIEQENTFCIELAIKKDQIINEDWGIEGEAFSFYNKENAILIEGASRVGVLYGVYEFLNQQGICWLNPWEEIVPKEKTILIRPLEKLYKPSFPLGRGFEFEGELKESEKLFLWMARNKLNLSSYRAGTAKLQKKLGMIFKNGGHIFEGILAPDNVMTSGKTIWEEHPDWYGLPKNRIRKKDEALYTQFCMTNDELLNYLSKCLLEKLQTDWYHADRVDIWGFDTWGNTCTCKKCSDVGNSSDQYIYFMSYLRDYFDNAYIKGELDRRVRLVFCAYEGTASLEAPKKKIPINIQKSGDYFTYAPIIRCYEHVFADDACEYNAYYNKHLSEWKDIPMGITEYYNVSKFEDLPLLFTSIMIEDFRYYHNLGVKCMTYMHLPLLLWGVRNITQYLYAALCWDVDIDAEKLISQYFQYRYGQHASKIRKVYELLEKAGKHCTSWRAWGPKSILSNLQNWDGGKPDKPLFRDSHLGNKAGNYGELSVSYYKEAIKILEEEKQKAENAYLCNNVFSSGIAVNQTDMRFQSSPGVILERINEDLISVRYGKDCMELITLFVKYYELLESNNDAGEVFYNIELLCEKMSSYYFPLRYDGNKIEVTCYDALTRVQLKDLYYRCKRKRLLEEKNNGING